MSQQGERGVATHRRRHVHTQVRNGVCVTERGACQQIGEGVPTHRGIVNMCFIRMHTALDCAVCGHACVCVCVCGRVCVGVRVCVCVCGRACVCDSVNMPVSCALYVRVIDDQAFVSAKLS